MLNRKKSEIVRIHEHIRGKGENPCQYFCMTKKYINIFFDCIIYFVIAE